MAQQFVTSSGAAVGPRIQDIDQSGVSVQRPVAYWRHISWAAILAGAVLATAIQMLLTLLGTGIGLVTLGATEAAGADAGTGFGIAAGVWWLVTGLISLFIGGLCAGRLARVSQATDGIFHGLLVWAVTTLFSVYLLTTAASNLIGGSFTALNSYLANPNAQSTIQQAIPGAGAGASQDRSVGAQEPTGTGPAAGTPAAGERVGGAPTQEGPLAQVEEEDVREAASNTGQVALWSFFALSLGAVAAAWGGAAGRTLFSKWDEPTTVVSRTTVPNTSGTMPTDSPNP